MNSIVFWHEKSSVYFQSHRKVRGRPKYEVMGDIFGTATLTIIFDDFERHPEHKHFDSIEEAKRYAERFEIDTSSS
jgi:hypothetical protein